MFANFCFEIILLQTIIKHLSQHNIIQSYRYGFQPGISTAKQINRLTSNNKTQWNVQKPSDFGMLDLEKAFVQKPLVPYCIKLISFNSPPNVIQLIQSFLSDRKCFVQIRPSSKSNVIHPPAGLPQGSLLSPVLVILFTLDQNKICYKILFSRWLCYE